MKVLQLSTSLMGGAGIAATRAHDALISEGVDSTLLSLQESNSGSEARGRIVKIHRSRLEVLESKALTTFQRVIIQKGPHLQTPLSIGIDTKRFSIEDYDVVHIHSTYNLANTKTLGKILGFGKPTYITLHDQRLTSGGCHGSMDCRNYRSGCFECPQVRFPFKSLVSKGFKETQELLRLAPNSPTLIVPSMWLANVVSEVFPESKFEVVRNCIPDDFFDIRKTERAFYKNTKKNIGFMSLDLNNPYKGLDTLLKSISLLDDKSRELFELVLVGEGEVRSTPPGLEVVTTGKIFGSKLQETMRNLDLLVIPSAQDNLPNVLCESLALGVPVIGSRVGGIPEILEKFNLPTFEAGNAPELASVLASTFHTISLEVDLKLARKLFSMTTYVESITEIYNRETY